MEVYNTHSTSSVAFQGEFQYRAFVTYALSILSYPYHFQITSLSSLLDLPSMYAGALALKSRRHVSPDLSTPESSIIIPMRRSGTPWSTGPREVMASPSNVSRILLLCRELILTLCFAIVGLADRSRTSRS